MIRYLFAFLINYVKLNLFEFSNFFNTRYENAFCNVIKVLNRTEFIEKELHKVF